ncbi:MAG: hypothetical protein COV52_01080 [Gammaproteobacteria bacterium CG11_big_fil_rev_8_21_14_0_20_46_22]|nr:MAG: hypothetical protein COW05_03370 [Gammaproteobacteria bacterium CG12_big_fil_rev_8_21_14_0_65_46_12]PIR12011.1 MAG: hypothetical protein COV52_01080 [Gammaproteobacteria bacterium CG11_big_fil_rev_8_21_14_0_20_46_22]
MSQGAQALLSSVKAALLPSLSGWEYKRAEVFFSLCDQLAQRSQRFAEFVVTLLERKPAIDNDNLHRYFLNRFGRVWRTPWLDILAEKPEFRPLFLSWLQQAMAKAYYRSRLRENTHLALGLETFLGRLDDYNARRSLVECAAHYPLDVSRLEQLNRRIGLASFEPQRPIVASVHPCETTPDFSEVPAAALPFLEYNKTPLPGSAQDCVHALLPTNSTEATALARHVSLSLYSPGANKNPVLFEKHREACKRVVERLYTRVLNDPICSKSGAPFNEGRIIFESARCLGLEESRDIDLNSVRYCGALLGGVVTDAADYTEAEPARPMTAQERLMLTSTCDAPPSYFARLSGAGLLFGSSFAKEALSSSLAAGFKQASFPKALEILIVGLLDLAVSLIFFQQMRLSQYFLSLCVNLLFTYVLSSPAQSKMMHSARAVSHAAITLYSAYADFLAFSAAFLGALLGRAIGPAVAQGVITVFNRMIAPPVVLMAQPPQPPLVGSHNG